MTMKWLRKWPILQELHARLTALELRLASAPTKAAPLLRLAEALERLAEAEAQPRRTGLGWQKRRFHQGLCVEISCSFLLMWFLVSFFWKDDGWDLWCFYVGFVVCDCYIVVYWCTSSRDQALAVLQKSLGGREMSTVMILHIHHPITCFRSLQSLASSKLT